MACLGGKKVSIIIQFFARHPCLMEARNCVGIAFIEEISVTEPEIGGSRSLPCVGVSIVVTPTYAAGVRRVASC